MSFANLRLSLKLACGFGVVLAIMVILSLIGINRISVLNQNVDYLAKISIAKLELSSDMETAIYQVAVAVRNMALSTDDAFMKKEKERIDKARANYDAAAAKLEQLLETTKGKELFANLKEVRAITRPLINKAMELGLANKNEAAAKVLIEEVRPNQGKWLELLDNLSALMKEQAHQKADESNQVATSGQMFLIFLSGGALILGVFCSFLIIRSITKPLNRSIGSLSEGADQVASASGQVSSASQQLAEGSSQQAASLEETSSSLEEMSSMTKQNAENASQANALMNEASKVVDKAALSMSELTVAMKEISTASEETAKIVKTIDEIAFQTNLLALNAAVEAARAGEAGAGFAVVADEVRNLAMRAADAAKNTANLIETTVNKVKGGAELVNRTAEDFAQVSGSTIKVKDLVGEIAAASNEQAQGVGQISKAVAEMDKVVQQNAANAEESASASEELSAQAAQMKSVVGDLVTLVEGNKNRGNRNSQLEFTRPVAKKTGKDRPLAIKPAAQFARMPVEKSGKTRVVTPEQVIPLDDKEFRDF